MSISLRLSDDDALLIKKCAELNNLSISEFIRQTVLERIEDEYDLAAYYSAMDQYKANPVSYPHDAVRQMLELN